MSQLVVRPGRNAAREAKRIKDVRKVKGAILWHERERSKRQKVMQQRFETRQAVLQLQRFEHDRVKARGKALRNAKEDWQLGSLRPNRAIGVAKEKYGALSGEEIQKPEMPLHALKSSNERRVKRGLEAEYPLIVDDKKYFHLAKDDRVVVIRGREMGKIGTIQTVIGRTHQVIVEGLNMQYFDAKSFTGTGEDVGPKRLSEVPISMDDLRLVIPYEITKTEDGETVKVREDVIVDAITMKQHTTGVDPYTNVDYGNAEFPKEHRYDPQTGLPIFHRYIAGTNHRIEWPWETEKSIEDSGVTEEAQVDSQAKWRKLAGAVLQPRTSLKRWMGNDAKSATGTMAAVETSEKEIAERTAEIEREVKVASRTAKPSSQDPRHNSAWDEIDTPADIISGSPSMQYTLVAPPFPDSLGEELRGHIHELNSEARKNQHKDDVAPVTKKAKKAKKSTEQSAAANELTKAKHAAAQRMKTPMQLRWEMEHAKKIKQQKTAPLVSMDKLMGAVGKHLQRNKQAKQEKQEQRDTKRVVESVQELD
ncbi:hypothetical protein DE146DRAFT_166020 [Phaeosphaeria sp. MPI-PUGE-AT-0046c]|nr:hypothetical protein DE146DRAFT_166020 [Phaeosphaeria sp. MPI-PUGE-AT-0046c]